MFPGSQDKQMGMFLAVFYIMERQANPLKKQDNPKLHCSWLCIFMAN
jgi:hypothetical protein